MAKDDGALTKDCSWVIGRDFNMTKKPEDKSHDCGRLISDLERFSWNALKDALQIEDFFQHRGS